VDRDDRAEESGRVDDAGGTIRVSGQGRLELTPPTSGTYQGITIFQNRTSSAPIRVTGQGELRIAGTLYAPTAEIDVSGKAEVEAWGNPHLIASRLKVSCDGNLDITQFLPNVAVVDGGGVYNGQPFPASATVNGAASLEGVAPTLSYYAGTGTGGAPLAGAPRAPGIYTVVAFFAGSTDYLSASAQATFTIAKAAPAVSVSDAGGTFNGSVFPATVTVAGVVPGVDSTPAASIEGVTPTVTYYAGSSASGTALLGAPTNAGTYTALAAFAGSADYTNASNQTTFTITKAEPTVSVSDAGGTFNGQPFPATATVAGVVPGVDKTPTASLEGVIPTLSHYVGSSVSGTPLAGAPLGAGTYTVLAVFAGSADYSSASAQTTFTISQATPTVSVSDAGGTFNGQPFPATATVAGVVPGVDNRPAASLEGVTPTVTYYTGTYTLANLPATGGSSTAPSAAGSYTVVAAFAGSTDYKAVSSLTTFDVAFPLDTTPPVIDVTSPASGLLTNSNITVSGQVTDVGTGVASLQAALDGGAFAPVSFDTSGNFSLATALALDHSADGPHTEHLKATDRAGNVSTLDFSFTLDTQAPVISVANPTGTVLTNQNITVSGTVSDALSGVQALQMAVDSTSGPFTPVTLTNGNFSFATALPSNGSADGPHTIYLQASDKAGNISGFSTVSFTLDTQAPTITIQSPTGSLTTLSNFTVTGKVTDNLPGALALQVHLDSGQSGPVTVGTDGSFSFLTSLPLDGSADGSHVLHFQARDLAGNASTVVDVPFLLDPLNAAVAAPPLDLTEATTAAAATQFLYTGSNPIQTGVAPGTIDPTRTAVLMGKVLDRAGNPLPLVTITVLGHPEFGSTKTDLAGKFSMVVNGGSLLTVNYALNGYLTVQRQVQPVWNDFANLPDVVLIQPDNQVTMIDLTASTPVQVARGSSETDSEGTRQNTLFFFQGTQATMTLPNGTTQPLNSLHVRATEYTVGATGLEAMPGDLPATSHYTYAVNYSVDEAVAAGATQVNFNHPVISYLENFLGFPVGLAVPDGYYDATRGVWVPSTNGVIIKVLSVTNGLADLDIDGSGKAASAAALAALGITDAERQQLASLYQPSQSLWRVPITHFSSWDSNYGASPPQDAISPNQPDPQPDQPCGCTCSSTPDSPMPSPDDPSIQGSIIDPLNQVLGESVNVAGTPFTLNYESDRVPGREQGLVISLSGANVPADLLGIELSINVDGEVTNLSFPNTAHQSYTF
jgi:hypothetical protein